MTLIAEAPTAIHVGASDLPWVDIGDGRSLAPTWIAVGASAMRVMPQR